MKQPAAAQEQLFGLEAGSSAAEKPVPVATPARPRVKPVDRSQLTWQMLDVERLIESRTPDIGGLKMSAFFSGRLPDRVAQPELRSWKQRWDRLKFLA
jgi:hypothetical protein